MRKPYGFVSDSLEVWMNVGSTDLLSSSETVTEADPFQILVQILVQILESVARKDSDSVRLSEGGHA